MFIERASLHLRMPLTRSHLLGFHNLLNISDLKDLERKELKLTSYKKFMDKAEQRLETRDMLLVLITADVGSGMVRWRGWGH